MSAKRFKPGWQLRAELDAGEQISAVHGRQEGSELVPLPEPGEAAGNAAPPGALLSGAREAETAEVLAVEQCHGDQACPPGPARSTEPGV